MWLLSINLEDDKNINLYEVSNISDSDDPVIRDIYHQFNAEDDILFNLFGNGLDNGYYGYYYKDGELTSDKLDDVVKMYLTIHSYDYKNAKVNLTNNCYEVSIDDLKITYDKLFNKGKLRIKNSVDGAKIDLNDDKVCIYDSAVSEYAYTLDTMFVNAVYQDNELLIYERVVFIKLSDNDVEFYSDYEMQDLIYKGKRSDMNFGFINNLNIVSNVLMKYQDKFDIYTYVFEKINGHYYFKSVSK